MRKTRIAGLLTAVAALVTMFAIPAVSGANHNHVVKSNIKVTNAKPFLQGVIASKREACERDRYVVVKRRRPGRNKLVGVDRSSYNGGWSVDVNRSGTYNVRMRRALSSDGRFVCSRDRDTGTIG